jgi:hypothetical protein
MRDNSCNNCMLCSNDDRGNGYFDLKCNIWYRSNLLLTPFKDRQLRIMKGEDEVIVESELHCPYYISFEVYLV